MAEMRSMVESTKGTVTGVSARAYQHIVGEVAVRARVSAFIPEYSLGPQHSFPATVEDAR
jgi:acetyl esterase/lipase